jgi:fructose/tagatose bisphosphate aldolase
VSGGLAERGGRFGRGLTPFARWPFYSYDPRVWVREGEKTMKERVQVACQDLGNVNR